MKALVMAVAAMALPTSAMAQTVTVKRGETVTVTITDDGSVRESDRQAIEPNGFEIASSSESQRGDYDQAIGPKAMRIDAQGSGKLAPPPISGKIVIRFIRTPGKDQSMLSIQNGYDRGFVYRATMHVGGKSQPTDVCLVIPGKIGNEYWPFPIDALDLADGKLVPWRMGDPLPCV